MAADADRHSGEGDVCSSGDSSDDHDICRRLAAGDVAAFDVLYGRYAGLATGLAVRMLQDRAAAEDVVQESFVQLWRKRAALDPDRAPLRSWLLTTVHHRCIDLLRQQALRRRFAAAPAEMWTVCDDEDTWSRVAERDTTATVRGALGRLPAEQRAAIELAFLGDRTHREIADSLNLPLGTVKGRIRLGMDRLRRMVPHPDECALQPVESSLQSR